MDPPEAETARAQFWSSAPLRVSTGALREPCPNGQAEVTVGIHMKQADFGRQMEKLGIVDKRIVKDSPNSFVNSFLKDLMKV